MSSQYRKCRTGEDRKLRDKEEKGWSNKGDGEGIRRVMN